MILRGIEFLTRFFEAKKLKKKAMGMASNVAKKAEYMVSTAENRDSFRMEKLGLIRARNIRFAPDNPACEKNSLKETWEMKKPVIKNRIK
jgi:hypothetical protein